VLSLLDAIDNPHLRERGTVRDATDRVLGEIKLPGLPLRFSAFPGELPVETPFLGEHNREVLQQSLGLSGAEIDELERDGVLFERHS
jgi:crotonobetainyl-CoA:carnitine CoA-transferase CaiB-like acyl-CoA transferase